MRNVLPWYHAERRREIGVSRPRDDVELLSSDEDADVSAYGCKWRLTLEESVYDDALLRPLCSYGHQSSWQQLVNSSSVLWTLIFNLLLQGVVLWRINYVVKVEKEASNQAFRGGACLARHNGAMPFKVGIPGYHDSYLDCSPLLVSMMSNVNNLDYDNDGYWTENEAEALGRQWRAKYGKLGNLSLVFENIVTLGHIANMTNDWQKRPIRIPMPSLRALQGKFDLCANLDSNMCGNLEARGILEKKFVYLGNNGPRSPDQRIAACAELVTKQCVEIYGQLYLWYSRVVRETCGELKSGWSNTSVVTARYHKPDFYALTISTISYGSFLLVILAIWLLVVLNELRDIVNWWIVICAYPSVPAFLQEKPDVVARSEDKLKILAIPLNYKFLTLSGNLLPRTIICSLLAIWGGKFLLYADSYSELILNSVALGFLIEIDNFMFHAVVDESARRDVRNCEPMESECCSFKSCAKALDTIPKSTYLVIMVGLVAFYMILGSYTGPDGKIAIAAAYTCLCHSEGDACVAAQILGGLAKLPQGAFS